jgi:hypothetical protein
MPACNACRSKKIQSVLHARLQLLQATHACRKKKIQTKQTKNGKYRLHFPASDFTSTPEN